MTANVTYDIVTSFDLMQHLVPFWSSAEDLYALERTSSAVQSILDQLKAWEKLHQAAFLPDVENGNYTYKSYRVLQRTMRGFTADVIAKHIGKPIGKACVLNAEIDELKQPDPKDPNKRKLETYKGILSTAIHRKAPNRRVCYVHWL